MTTTENEHWYSFRGDSRARRKCKSHPIGTPNPKAVGGRPMRSDTENPLLIGTEAGRVKCSPILLTVERLVARSPKRKSKKRRRCRSKKRKKQAWEDESESNSRHKQCSEKGKPGRIIRLWFNFQSVSPIPCSKAAHEWGKQYDERMYASFIEKAGSITLLEYESSIDKFGKRRGRLGGQEEKMILNNIPTSRQCSTRDKAEKNPSDKAERPEFGCRICA